MRLSLIKPPIVLCSLMLAFPGWATSSDRPSHIEYDAGVFTGPAIKLSTADQFQDIMFVTKLLDVLSQETRDQQRQQIDQSSSEPLELSTPDERTFWDHPVRVLRDDTLRLADVCGAKSLQYATIKDLAAQGAKGLSKEQKKALARISPDYLGLFLSVHANSGDYRRHHIFNVSSRPYAQTVDEMGTNHKAWGIIPGADLNPGKPFEDVQTFWRTQSTGAQPPKVVTHDQGLFYQYPERQIFLYHAYFLNVLAIQENAISLPWSSWRSTQEWWDPSREVFYIRRDRFNTAEIVTHDPGPYRSALNDGPGYRRGGHFNVPRTSDALGQTPFLKIADVISEVPGLKWRYKDHEELFKNGGNTYKWWSNKIRSSDQAPALRHADPGKYAPAVCEDTYTTRSKKFNVAETMTEDRGFNLPASASSYGHNIRRGALFNVKHHGVTPQKDHVQGADCRRITKTFSPAKEDVPTFTLKPVLYKQCGIKPGQVGLSQDNRYVIGLNKEKIFLAPQ